MGTHFSSCFICEVSSSHRPSSSQPFRMKNPITDYFLEKSADGLSKTKKKSSSEFITSLNFCRMKEIKIMKKLSLSDPAKYKNYINLFDNCLEQKKEMQKYYHTLLLKIECLLSKESHYISDNFFFIDKSISNPSTISPNNKSPTISLQTLRKLISQPESPLQALILQFSVLYFQKYKPEVIDNAFLKKLDRKEVEKIKEDAFSELKTYLIRPLEKIIKVIFESLLRQDYQLLENVEKSELKREIQSAGHKLIFKNHPPFYSFTKLLLSNLNKPLQRKLNSQQRSLPQYRFIDSFEVDIAFSCRSRDLNGKAELYTNAIERLNFLDRKKTPLGKLKLISSLHQQLWGSILKENELGDEKLFRKLRQKFDADNLLSLYSYVIFNSGNKRLHKEIGFVEEFIEEKELESWERSYYYEMFKSALDYITNYIGEAPNIIMD